MYEIVKILFILSNFIFAFTEGISCYRCSPTREYLDINIHSCTEFDWSAKYQVECPSSTLCSKRSYTVTIGEKTIHGIERDCAPQVEESQKYDHTARHWNRVQTIVTSVYKEGCSEGVDIGRPGDRSEWCYCSYGLCNGSSSFRKISYTLILVGTVLCMWKGY